MNRSRAVNRFKSKVSYNRCIVALDILLNVIVRWWRRHTTNSRLQWWCQQALMAAATAWIRSRRILKLLSLMRIRSRQRWRRRRRLKRCSVIGIGKGRLVPRHRCRCAGVLPMRKMLRVDTFWAAYFIGCEKYLWVGASQDVKCGEVIWFCSIIFFLLYFVFLLVFLFFWCMVTFVLFGMHFIRFVFICNP